MAFPINGVLDNFNRNDNSPPSASWTNIVNALSLVSNVVAGTAAGVNSGHWNPTPKFGPDVEAYFTITTVPSNGRQTYVMARHAGSVINCYAVKMTMAPGADVVQIVRFDAGTETSALGSDMSATFVNGNKLGIECVGNVITAYVDVGAGWVSLGSRLDTTYTGDGYIGIRMVSTAARVDDFGGGTISAGGGTLRTPTRQIIMGMNHFRGGTTL